MKIALIPPKGMEEMALLSNFHMTLAIRDCVANSKYLRVYEEASTRNDWIITDNGANELEPASDELLIDVASKLWAREIVLPDVVGDARGTAEAVQNFLKRNPSADRQFHLMAVVPGSGIREIMNLVGVYADIRGITTLGLPRLLLESRLDLGKAIRIDLANAIQHKYGTRFDIHLLGASRLWPVEVKYAATYAPHIRSMDTSLPFNYAMAGQTIANRVSVSRPSNYFTHTWPNERPQLLKTNIETFLMWSHGT